MANLAFRAQLDVDGIGGGFIPGQMVGARRPAQLVVARTDDRIWNRLGQVLKRASIPVARVIRDAGNGHTAWILAPGTVLKRADWAALGVRDYRLSDASNFVDLDNPSAISAAFSRARQDLSLDDDLFENRYVGLNGDGERVFASPLGRYVETRDRKRIDEWRPGSAGQSLGFEQDHRFLRPRSISSIRYCAKGVARMIAGGERFDANRILALHEALLEHTPQLTDAPGWRLIDLQEEVEGNLAAFVRPLALRERTLAASRGEPGVSLDAGRKIAVAFDDRMPTHNERTLARMLAQQYSTPFPLARVAYETLAPQDGERLLEPTIGNGVLASFYGGRGVSITGVELDPERKRRAQTALPGASVIEGNFLEADVGEAPFDLVVTNPPFDRLPRPEQIRDEFGRVLEISTLDRRIAYEALRRLKPSGRALMILPADMMKPERLDGERQQFDTYLQATYQIAGAAVMDGRLYRKMGTTFPVMIYALGPRREQVLTAGNSSEVLALRRSELPVLRSIDELFAWSAQTRERMIELTGLPDVEPSFTAPTPRPAPEAVAGPEAQVPAPATGQDAGAPETAREPGAGSSTAIDQGGGARSPTGGGRRTAAPAVKGEPDEREPEAPPIPVTSPPGPETPTAPGAPIAQEAAPEEIPSIIDDLEEDAFVVRYQPFSNLGEGTTMIQKSLQGPIYRALLEASTVHGDLDDFVSSKTGLGKEALAERLSPEQIDALSLIFAGQEKHKGFLISDLMGVGKGRTLAATALSAMREKRPIVFMTETPTLFSDFLARDVADVAGRRLRDMIEDGIVNPLVVNGGKEAPIRDGGEKPVVRGGGLTPQKQEIASDVNLVCVTYSQFQTAKGDYKFRAIKDWLRTFETKPLLILDEAHRAAGELSRTGVMIENLVDTAWAELGGDVVYSSATPLKGGRNIKVYKAVLPDTGLATEALIQLIESNPLALQEVLASEMARSGAMISREIDMRGAQRQFISLNDIDPALHEKIVAKVDHVAAFLSELVENSSIVDATAKAVSAKLQRGASKELQTSVQTTSPVAQFHTFSQYLMAAINLRYTDKLINGAIASGQKPVVVVENTGEELLKRFIERQRQKALERGAIDADGIRIDRLPHIGDVLIENAEKMLEIKVKDAFGGDDVIYVEELRPWLDDFKERVERASLELLTVSPIDAIREYAASVNLTSEELTKRDITATRDPAGGYRTEPRSGGTPQSKIKAFNNGETDLLIINRSAATGVSLHASPATGADLRPRVMIKLQVLSEITAERQMDGRIHRFAQVHPGSYWIPLSGFAAQDRLFQLFNKKNRSLTAASSATRDNATNVSEAADLLNVVGESVVRQYLEERPSLAEKLGLGVPSESEDGGGASSYARKLMGRLVCLPKATQDRVLSELDMEFRMRVEALDAKGLNPLKLAWFDWRATVKPVAVLQAGDSASESIGKQPLNLVELSYRQKIAPIDWERVTSAVDRGRAALTDKMIGRYVSPAEVVGSLIKPDGEPDWASSAFDGAFNRLDRDRALALDEISPEAAHEVWLRRASIDMDDKKTPMLDRRVIRAGRIARFLASNIDALEPGRTLELPAAVFPGVASAAIAETMAQKLDRNLTSIPAVITSVSFDQNDLLNLSRWHFKAAIPGDRDIHEFSLAGAFGVIKDMTDEERNEHGITGDTAVHFVGDFVRTMAKLTGPDQAFSDIHYRNLKAAGLGQGDLSFATDFRGGGMDADFARTWTLNERQRALFDVSNDAMGKYLKSCFDDAPAGSVFRKKYALEGNMFVALKIAQGREKLGEKAIFTTDNGEIRHAVVLKAEKLELLKSKLNAKLAAVSQPVEFARHKDTFVAFLRTIQFLRSGERSRSREYENSGEIALSEPLKGRVVSDLSLLLGDGLEPERYRTFVEENLDGLVHRLTLSLHNDKVPAGLFVGTDPFSDTSDSIGGLNVKKHQCYEFKDKQYLSSQAYLNTRAYHSALTCLGDNSLFVDQCVDSTRVFFSKKAKQMIDVLEKHSSRPSVTQVAVNEGLRNEKLTKGLVSLEAAREADRHGFVADVLMGAAAVAGSSVMASGGITGLLSTFEHERRLALEAVKAAALLAASAFSERNVEAPSV